jgi:hypothetical protein
MENNIEKAQTLVVGMTLALASSRGRTRTWSVAWINETLEASAGGFFLNLQSFKEKGKIKKKIKNCISSHFRTRPLIFDHSPFIRHYLNKDPYP